MSLALKSGPPRADVVLMVFDVLALGLFVGGWYAFWQESRHTRCTLPADDLPPPAARTPLPRHARLRGYVDEGLSSIDDFLAGAEAAADRADRADSPDRDRDQPA